MIRLLHSTFSLIPSTEFNKTRSSQQRNQHISRLFYLCCTAAFVLSMTSCKPFGNSSTKLQGANCLLNKTIESFSVFVAIGNFDLGNVNYHFEFSENFYIPYIYGQYTPNNADQNRIIGWDMQRGLKVQDKLKYLKAEYITPCLGNDYWASRGDNNWPQDPTIRIDVNSVPFFQATFQPMIIDLPDACSQQGKKAKKVVIEKVTLASNPTYAEHRRLCN